MNAKKRKMQKRRSNIIAYVLLAAFLIIIAAYMLTHLTAPSFIDDDTAYETAAFLFLHGMGQYPPPYSARLLQIIPLAIFYKLLGVNLLSNALWDIISTLVLVAATFYIGKELYNEYAGLLAAVLAFFFPAIILLSSTGIETIPAAMFASVAALFFLKGYGKNSAWWYFGSGTAMAASFLASPIGAVSCVAILAYMLFLVLGGRRNKAGNRITRNGIHVLSGILFSIIVLMAFDYIRSGNPLLTLQISYGFASGPYFIPPAAPSNFYKILLIPLGGLANSSMFFYLAIVASIYLLSTKSKNAYFPIFWLSASVLYLLWGPMYVSLFPPKYVIIPPEWRSLVILSTPIAVSSSIFLVKLFERSKKCAHRLAVVVFVVVIFALLLYHSVVENGLNYSGYLYSMKPEFYLASYLNALPNSTKIAVPMQLPNIVIYMHFDNISRFHGYNIFAINCTFSEGLDYVIVENFSSAPHILCPSWQQVDFLQNTTDVSTTQVYLYRQAT